MSERLLDLAARRGALQARIATQRQMLAQHAAPLSLSLSMADKAAAGVDWAKHNPLPVGAAVAVLAILKPRRAWRWARRSFFLWQGWQRVRRTLSGL